MEAKDTVISDEEIKKIGAHLSNPKSILKARLEAQAEISFKAGIEEIVGWIQTHQSCDITPVTFNRKSVEFCVLIKNKEWQAFLKGKGFA